MRLQRAGSLADWDDVRPATISASLCVTCNGIGIAEDMASAYVQVRWILFSNRLDESFSIVRSAYATDGRMHVDTNVYPHPAWIGMTCIFNVCSGLADQDDVRHAQARV